MIDGVAVVERWMPAPPATTYRFFTVADQWIRWNGTAASIDARPGGRLRIDAYGDVAVGVFQDVVPNERLVFTWGWESGNPLPPESSLVEIDFASEGDGTRLKITHSRLPQPVVQRHRERWSGYLDFISQLG